MQTLSENRCFGGTQGIHSHRSEATGTEMTFGLYLPPGAGPDAPVPLLWFLSGLTCTHENAMVKAGAQAHAAEAGIALCFPDTSPRGEGVADDEAYDLGQGAGFYVDATEAPWVPQFRMKSYIAEELPGLLARHFPTDPERQAITGHSMGGHGALTLAMTHPGRYRSVSAFSPICNPSQSDWGRKQLTAYLGPDTERWAEADATRLMDATGLDAPLLLDTGTADQFWDLLGTEAFAAACARRRTPAQIRLQSGYDHSYFFVSTFIADHIAFHAEALWS